SVCHDNEITRLQSILMCGALEEVSESRQFAELSIPFVDDPRARRALFAVACVNALPISRQESEDRGPDLAGHREWRRVERRP
ncbi:hypothetical protein ACFVZE_38905, partial [Streptomyces anulatus]|uniref:hypothetical protein n=1 Tax=Streptomyces anulatus TaxID=1892 RepID=UPI0036DF7480